MLFKRWKEEPDIGSYTNVADDDYVPILDTSDSQNEKKLTITNLIKKILGNRSFGGSGNIVTADTSNQTMSLKRINWLKLNSDTQITINGAILNKFDGWDGKSDDLNKLTNTPATKTDFSNLSGTSANIQEQINNLFVSETAKIYHHSVNTIVSGGAGIIITEADLRYAAGVSSAYRVAHTGILVNTYVLDAADTWNAVDPSTSPGLVRIKKKVNAASMQDILDNITISYGDTANVMVSIIFKVIGVAGV